MSNKRPEAPARDPDRFSPVFVLTTARSYSSVVTMMVGQHPELFGLPELKLFSYSTIGELQSSLPRYWLERGVKHRSPGLVRAVAQFQLGNQQPESLVFAQRWLQDRSHWCGSDVFDYLVNYIGSKEPVEKSPENTATDAALTRLASAYPRARYLHLTRHPIATQRSMQEHWKRVVPDFALKGQPMAGIASWVEIHCRILRFAATLENSSYLCLRAEDLLNDTPSQLRLIAEWLRIRTDVESIEAMLHPERSPFATLGHPGSGVAGGCDPNFLSDPIPHQVEIPRTLNRPSGWVGNSSLWNAAVDVANRLGYR
jgi:hypothetical protein